MEKYRNIAEVVLESVNDDITYRVGEAALDFGFIHNEIGDWTDDDHEVLSAIHAGVAKVGLELSTTEVNVLEVALDNMQDYLNDIITELSNDVRWDVVTKHHQTYLDRLEAVNGLRSKILFKD